MQNNLEQLPAISEDQVAGYTIKRSKSERNLYDIFAVDSEGESLVCVEANLDLESAIALVDAVNSTFPVNLTPTELVEVELNGQKRIFNAKKG